MKSLKSVLRIFCTQFEVLQKVNILTRFSKLGKLISGKTQMCVPTWHKARAESGVSSAGFITTVHPAARAGAAFLHNIEAGKFHYKGRRKKTWVCVWFCTKSVNKLKKTEPKQCQQSKKHLFVLFI